jgi:hypothetical protein
MIARTAVILSLRLIDMMTPFGKKDAGSWMLAAGCCEVPGIRLLDLNQNTQQQYNTRTSASAI